jgi:hypothetical protein
MTSMVTISIAGTPTPIVLFDGNTLEAAEQAAAAAASAAAAQALVGPVYADTTAGLAATAPNGFFAVNASGIVTIYQDVAGTAVAQRTLPTSATLAAGDGSELIGYQNSGTGPKLRTVRARLKDTLNAADYGVGDGGYNQATAINNAIAALPSRGGLIELPNVEIALGTNTITWPAGKYIDLVGQGGPPEGNGTDHTGATQISYTGTGNPFPLIGTAFDSDQIGGSIRNLSMKGPGLGTSARAVDLKWASMSSGNFTMEDVYIYNWGSGIRIDAALSLSWRNVTVRGCTTAWDLNPTAEAVNANRFYNCNAISCDTGVRIFNSANGNQFFGGTFEGTGIGAYILGDANAPHNNMFHGCWFESDTVGARGVLIYTNPVNPDPQGNSIIDCLFTSQNIGIELNTCDGTRIEGNRFFNFAGAKVPVRVDADAINTIIRDNVNAAGNNDYNVAAAGAGLVIDDVVSNIRRTRFNNNAQTLMTPAGLRTFYGDGLLGRGSSIGRSVEPCTHTTAERDAIATWRNGEIIYNSSTNKAQVRASGAWVDLH